MRKWVKWALIILVVVIVITIVVAAICAHYRRPDLGTASIDEYYRPQVDLPHPTAVNEYWHVIGFTNQGPLIMDADRYKSRFITANTNVKIALVEPEPDLDLALISKKQDTWMQRLVEDNGWSLRFGPQTKFPISEVTLTETRGPCLVGPMGYIEVGRHRTANVSHFMMREGQGRGIWFLFHGWVTNSKYISTEYPPHKMASPKLTYYYLLPDQTGDTILDHVAIVIVICSKTGTGLLVYQRKNGGRTELNDITYKHGLFTSASTSDHIKITTRSLSHGVRYGTYTFVGETMTMTGRVASIKTNVLGTRR